MWWIVERGISDCWIIPRLSQTTIADLSLIAANCTCSQSVASQEIMVNGDPVTLKAAYRAFFSKIVVGPEDDMGQRKIRYFLKGNPDVDEGTRVWDRTQMVEATRIGTWSLISFIFELN